MLPVTHEPRTRGRRRVRALGALAVGAAILLLTGSASAAPAAVPSATVTPAVFGIGPASATKVDGRPYYYYLTGPGGSLQDHVAIVNVGTAPLTVTVYPTDAGNSADGSFAFPTASTKPQEVGTWIRVGIPDDHRTVTVKGRTTLIFPVTVTIPTNATPGDHAGALIASLQGEVTNAQGQLIHLDQRVATRVFVRVSGPLHPKLAIENLKASYHGSLNPFAKGDVTVTYTVHNVGNVKLGGLQAVTVTGLLGTSASAPSVPNVPLLLPGGSASQSVTVHGVLPTVWETAQVTVRATALPSDSDGPVGPWTATTHVWAVPWGLILLLLLLVGCVVAWRRLRRRGGPAAAADEPDPEDVASTEPATASP